VDRFITGGEQLQTIPALKKMAGVMRMLRTDESSIERKMSQITQLYRKKAHSSESGVSMMLRWGRLVDLCSNPERLEKLVPEFNHLCSAQHLHELVARLVGGPGCTPGFRWGWWGLNQSKCVEPKRPRLSEGGNCKSFVMCRKS
jgi:hypothetical protein